MTSLAHCSRCGIELSDDAPQGLCPQCLIKVGMESNTVDRVTGDANDVAQTESFHAGPDSPKPSPKKKADLPAPGDQFGNYRLIRKLGEGGMGAVFEAEDLNGERQVALKLLAHSLESGDARNRFFREGRLAASINHPNSVYVFGTEEIDGTPAISMEHISGGTLQDRVRQHGPLPVNEAVDVILQIISGLEAAAKVGVLHRDIKPSNCFVDMYGTVKIGDFGLSISTKVRGDSHLTEPGAFLGTPAFASPEQLRGDELDIRSDIYAVGVTLYYLLTGKTPFEAENLVKLLATVLEQPAPSPAHVRTEIPNGLSRIVQRCLAKQPADRFTKYADLREALVPYTSTAPTPATLALRGLAGICDHLIWTVPIIVLQIAWFRDFATMTDPDLFRSPSYIALMIVVFVLHILYFAIPEGIWGASLGKLLCRLRVVDHRRSSIGVRRALLRTVIYVCFPSLIVWIYWLCSGVGPMDYEKRMSDSSGYWTVMLVSYSYYVMLALLFSTARRRNGFSGLHDLVTGAHVVLQPPFVGRPNLDVEEIVLPERDEKQTIGPYHILDSLEQTASEEFLLAYDTRLLRRVWIHKFSENAPAIAGELRNMGRAGRLRWINGRREPGEYWDAYEALSGRPLLELLAQPQSWAVVRYWLMDLSSEICMAEQDGTMPTTLSLDRVWITSDGRAKLLDFTAPGTHDRLDSTKDELNGHQTSESAVHFLFHVAASALQGRIVGPKETSLDEASVLVPAKARLLLERLPVAEVTPAEAAAEFQAMTRGMPTVTRLRRVAMFSTIAVIPIFIGIISGVSWYMFSRWNEQSPKIVELRNCLIYMDKALDQQSQATDNPEATEEEQRAFEIYVAGTFRETIEDKKSWNSFVGRSIPLPLRVKAKQIVAENAPPTAEELREATLVVEPLLTEFEQSMQKVNQLLTPLALGLTQSVVFWVIFIMIPGMIAAAVFRRGLVMRAFGVECVDRNGRPASRLRMFWRSILSNSPVLLGPVLLAFILPLVQDLTLSLLPIVGLVAALAILSLSLPQRGIPDRLSGTYSVPS